VESLALLVGIILLMMILSGPIAIGLTFIRISNPVVRTIRRVFVLLFSAIGIALGAMLIIDDVALGAKVFALVAILACAYALKREFKRR
jgi:hypothetical protein